MEEKQLSVLIIGAGTKGAFGPFNHAAAFNDGGFKISGFIDSDKEKAKKAASFWDCGVFNTIEEAFSDKSFDVVVVATPDSTHQEVLNKLVGKKCSLIFAEKPFCQNSKDAKALLSKFRKTGQSISVNYTRRFIAPTLKQIVKNSGDLLGGSAFYGKGLHNLCHWVDLFLAFDIDPLDIKYTEIDRSKINVFDAFLYFAKTRLSISNLGTKFSFSPVIPREDFTSDRVVSPRNECLYSFDTDRSMKIAVNNIKDHLKYGCRLISTGQNALKVLEISEKILS